MIQLHVPLPFLNLWGNPTAHLYNYSQLQLRQTDRQVGMVDEPILLVTDRQTGGHICTD